MNEQETKKGPNWYTIKAAAEYLEVGEQTIYRWMREGKITFRKIGDATRFLQQDIDEVVQIFRSSKDAKTARQACPLCHHDFLSDGDIRSTGLIYFRPAKTKFWSLSDSNIKTSAKMCPNCGAITLFGDLEKLAKLQAKPNAKKEQEECQEEPKA